MGCKGEHPVKTVTFAIPFFIGAFFLKLIHNLKNNPKNQNIQNLPNDFGINTGGEIWGATQAKAQLRIIAS
jgi:hypothetical protein